MTDSCTFNIKASADWLSRRLEAIRPSPTIAITQLANELRRAGKNIIGLSQGEPDFETPAHIREAAKVAIDSGKTRYTDVDGTPELKDAIIGKFSRENGLDYTARQITVGTGGKQVLFNALAATLNDGDEVVIPAPYWVSYPDMVLLAAGKPVTVTCTAKDDFKLTPGALREALSPRTKWLILNSPSNPTGSGYSEAELRALSEVLLEYPHVLVLTDDMYEHIRYDDWKFATIAAVEPKLKDRTLTCNGVSKAYAMTGWRIGYGGGPAWLIAAMAKIQSQSTTNPSSISQAAALAALTGPMDFLAERNAQFQKRRDLCLEALNGTPGLSCLRPDGAFYLFPSCAGLIGKSDPRGKVIATDVDFAAFLLDEAGVAVVPGSAFGLDPYFRISFATATDQLEAAMANIATACAKLS